MSRDWLKSLFKASYKGTPFWVEKDDENGGRRIVEHQFPMSDVPYLEDLGEDVRHFEVTAYVASDSADAEAGQLVATCATRGPGILVLPTHGMILVRCLSFTRNRNKDQHGYIAHSLKFSREGASSALITTSSLANLVFIAADSLAAATAASFVANFQPNARAALAAPSGGSSLSAGPVDFVVAAAVDTLQTAAATLEAIRTAEPVAATTNAKQRDEIKSIFDQLPDLLADPSTVSGAPSRIIASARALGDAMPAATAVRAFEAVVTDPAVSVVGTSSSSASVVVAASYPTPNLRAAAYNEAAALRTLRLAALAAYCEAVVRLALTDRPSGITIRANVAEYFEAEVINLPASEIELVHAIDTMRDTVIEYLSLQILDLSPVLTVEANLSMPSLFWAWRLYQDPTRSPEIVARNLVQHPSFMPLSFEALAR